MASERFFKNTKRKKDKGSFLMAVCLFLCVIAVAAYYVLQVRMLPVLANIALSKLQDVTTSAVLSAVNSSVESNNVQYDDVITLKTDSSGGIVAIETNTANVNKIQARIAVDVLSALHNVDTLVIPVPVGRVFSDFFMNDAGPTYDFRVLTTSSVVPKLENRFTEAGINQTRHQIMLRMRVPISVLLRGKSYSDTVEISVCIAETILVGKVPNVYAILENGQWK